MTTVASAVLFRSESKGSGFVLKRNHLENEAKVELGLKI